MLLIFAAVMHLIRVRGTQFWTNLQTRRHSEVENIVPLTKLKNKLEILLVAYRDSPMSYFCLFAPKFLEDGRDLRIIFCHSLSAV